MAEFDYSSEREYDGYLRINSCGKRELQGKDYVTVRPKGRIDYSIQYIREGKGYVEIQGQLRPVEAGSLILYFPGVSQRYVFREQEPTLLMWSHFTGTACDLLELFRAEQAVILTIRDRSEFERNFEKMITAFYHREPYSSELGQGYMTVLLSLLCKSRGSGGAHLPAAAHEGLERVLSHMYTHYNQPVDLAFYAEMCFVSKNRFIHLFKSYTGLPPYRYQLKIRIDWARQLLENTNISVKECAKTVGFSDFSYFGRVFKKFTGHPPGYFKS